MSSILICDGDASFVDSLEKLLSEQGYEIETTQHAGGAIRRILSRRFKAVILGTNAKGMSILEAISIVNRIDQDLPIITVAEDDSLDMERKVRMEKIFYYFVKPVDSNEMIDVVRQALAKSCLRS